MMKREFEALANRTVTAEQYKEIEALYMASNLNKIDFVKSISKVLKSIPEEKPIKKVIIGVKAMPNGTWMTYEAELIDVNLRTSKIEVKRLSDNRCWAETGFDIHYTRVKEV